MRLAKLTDCELVEAAQKQDRAAFEELLARHDGAAFQSALNILRDCYDDADDACQQARISAWECLCQLRGEFGPWYMTIVRNACNRLYRERRRTQDWMSLDDIGEIVASPLDVLVKVEERSYIRGAVDALAPRQADCIRRHFFDGQTYGEIASDLGLSEFTISRNVNEGLKNLRERLGERAGQWVS